MQDIPGWTDCPVLHKRLGLHVQAQCWSSKSPGSLLVPAQPAFSNSRVLDITTETQQQSASAYSPVIFLGQTLKLLQQPEAYIDSNATNARGSDTIDVAFTSSFVGCCPLLGEA